METITIAGAPYQVPVRYEEGHELTAGEASALNQTFHENIRNNLAKKAKEGSLTQAEVDAYSGSYQFGVRVGGGAPTRDPVMSEALRIAKDQIKAALKKKGRKVSDVEASAINEAAKKLVGQNPQILELAKQRVAEQQAAATEDLSSLVADIPAKPAEAPATPATPPAG